MNLGSSLAVGNGSIVHLSGQGLDHCLPGYVFTKSFWEHFLAVSPSSLVLEGSWAVGSSDYTDPACCVSQRPCRAVAEQSRSLL